MAEFQAGAGTRKGIVNTFITTYGILNANSSSLVNSEVVLDDLFKQLFCKILFTIYLFQHRKRSALTIAHTHTLVPFLFYIPPR